MAEDDRFAQLVRERGEPQNARKLPAHEAGKYGGRVPRALIDFWVEHGFGSYKKGYCTLCDPIAFDPVVRTIFKDDPEIDPSDVCIIGYTASSNAVIIMWHKDGRNTGAYPNDSELSISPHRTDPQSGAPLSEYILITDLVLSFLNSNTDIYEEDVAQVGRPAEGEVIGYVPARQLGGDDDNLQRVKALEYFGFLAQLEPYKVMELTPPEPGYPFGKFRFVRYAGPKPQ